MADYIKNNSSSIPWIEKYRPRTLNAIIQQSEIKNIFNNSLNNQDFPHVLLYGPPGTGKTSIILALAYELFGPNIIEDRVLELNASDNRGINIVRDKIIRFSNKIIGQTDPNYPCPEFKLIILDEIDAMTYDAQNALRIIIEESSHITRYCLMCNYINKIIEPIKSRCSLIKFIPLNKSDMFSYLTKIINNERLILNDECLDKIIDLSEGDMRRAIMSLQNINYISKYKTITLEDIEELHGELPSNYFNNIIQKIKNSSIIELNNFVIEIYEQSYIIKNVLVLLIQELDDLNPIISSQIIIKISEINQFIIEGCDEHLQLLNLFIYIKNILN